MPDTTIDQFKSIIHHIELRMTKIEAEHSFMRDKLDKIDSTIDSIDETVQSIREQINTTNGVTAFKNKLWFVAYSVASLVAALGIHDYFNFLK